MSSPDYDFNKLFIATKGGPVVHGDRTLLLSDRIPAKLGERFLVTIISTSSEYPQGVGISDGVEVFGEHVRRAVVWEYFSLPPELRSSEKSRLPYTFEVTCSNKSGYLSFYNMAEVSGRQEWWHYASCMTAQNTATGRLYHCNDFQPNDDFIDLVFSVERITKGEQADAGNRRSAGA